MSAAAQARYKKRHPDRVRASDRRYRLANRERIRASQRQQARNRYLLDPDRKRYLRAWARTLRGKLGKAVYQRARRARQRGAPGRATTGQIAARLAYYGGRCWICGGMADTMDHVIPLAKGGTNWPSNQRPACRSCNGRKSDRR